MSTSEAQHDQLPAYAAGTLDTAAAERFHAHLADCLVCRRELDFMRQVAEGAAAHGPEFFADHPEVDDIVALATGQDVGVADATVRRHVELCAACAAEVGWVRGTADPFAPARGVAAAPVTAPRPWSARMGWLAAAAAVVVLGLVLTLRPGQTTLEDVAGPSFVIDVQPVRLAGADEFNHAVVPADAVMLTLTIPVDLAPGGFPATVAIVDAADDVRAQGTVARQDDLLEGEFYGLACGVAKCPPGRYRVRITDRAAQTHEIPFTLAATE